MVIEADTRQHEWVLPEIPPSAIRVTNPNAESLTATLQSPVSMFRAMAPYIATHRGKTMILHVPGEWFKTNKLLIKHSIGDIGLFHSIATLHGFYKYLNYIFLLENFLFASKSE